jgi:hypothetical protein
MFIAQRAMKVLGIVLLLTPTLGAADHQSNTQPSPADLVNAVIRNELKPADPAEMRWKYLLDKEVNGKEETKEVVETNSGSLERLIAIAGRPCQAPSSAMRPNEF